MHFAGNLPGLRCGGLSNHDVPAPPNPPASVCLSNWTRRHRRSAQARSANTHLRSWMFTPPEKPLVSGLGGGGDGGCRIALSSSVAVSALLWSCDPLPVVLKEAAFALPVRDSKWPPADLTEDGRSWLKRPPSHKVNQLTQYNLSPNVAQNN